MEAHRERRAAELLPVQVRAEDDVGPEEQTSHLELAEDLVRQRAQAADDHVARRRDVHDVARRRDYHAPSTCDAVDTEVRKSRARSTPS